MFPLSLNNYFEFLALLCSLIFLKNIRHTPLHWFVPYLLLIVGIELAGRYIRTELHKPNAWLYNFSIPVEYLFFTFIFYSFYKSHFDRNLAKGFLLLFTVYVIISLGIRGISIFNGTVLIIGSFAMILFSLLYFVELYNRPGIIDLRREPVFWIAIGVLLFNAGEFSYDLLSKFFFKQIDISAAIFRSINKYLDLLLYLCISISFLWKRDTVTSNMTLQTMYMREQ